MFIFRTLAIRFLQFNGLLKLRPFDVSTAEGRSQERHRRAVLTTLASAAARSLSIATTLITVPLTLQYLGTERYGMWMTISSLVAMLSFADLGIGNGILNAVSSAYGADDFAAIREYVASGFLILSAIAVGIISLFLVLYHLVPWYEIFNVKSSLAIRDSGPSLAVFTICFALAMPLGIVQRLQLGLQKGFMASLWQGVSSLLALSCVLLAIWLRGGLPWLVLAFVGSPLISSLLNNIVFFGWSQHRYTPMLKDISRAAMKQIAHIGILFFVLQVVGSIVFFSDNIVIAHILGAKAVAIYAVPQRLFGTIPSLLLMALAPLWPAYGEAIAKGDKAWVKNTIQRSFFLSVSFAGIASFGLVVFGQTIIRIWVGNAIAPSLLLILGLGIWQVMQAGGNTIAMYLNGANIVKFQLMTAGLTAAVSIVLKVFLVEKIGIPGAVWSTIIAYGVCTALPMYWKITGLLRQVT